MYHYSAEDLTQKQQYKLMSGSVIPRPIAWITTLDKAEETINLAPFSFFSGASSVLPLISVSTLRKNGQFKDTARNLLDKKEAVVHIVTEDLAEAMNQTASLLPADQSEISLTNLTTSESKSIKTPAIKESKIRFETKLHQHFPIKDEDGNATDDLFILKITDFYFDEAIFNGEKGYVLQDKLKPVARLSGNNYSSLTKSYKMIRPDK